MHVLGGGYLTRMVTIAQALGTFTRMVTIAQALGTFTRMVTIAQALGSYKLTWAMSNLPDKSKHLKIGRLNT